MQTQMKAACEKCGAALPPDSEAYTCSYECTFCPSCAQASRQVCSHCGGELVRRARRRPTAVNSDARQARPRQGERVLLIWAISFGVWTLVMFAAAISLNQFYRTVGSSRSFWAVLAMQACQMVPYALLTPFVYQLAVRFPIQQQNWLSRSLLYLLGGVGFCLLHVILQGFTPYAIWDPAVRDWVSAFWNAHTHTFQFRWREVGGMFYQSLVEDFSSAYLPILLVGQTASYYRGLRVRESQALQLEGQLTKARLQSLKNQLQPHFLFNTLHSISALMLTNPHAADRMMSRLSELLRMNLENDGVQLTTLSQELEFVNGYLEIEKIRFEDKLSVFIDIPADTLDAPVPQLLLQPLAENAVRHGISRRSAPGWIRISARHDSGTLHLQVKDNGLGLTESLFDTSKGGMGLRTTKERLATLYGSAQTLEIRNAPEGGVEVNVRIPYVPASPDPGLLEEQDEIAREGDHEWARKPSGL